MGHDKEVKSQTTVGEKFKTTRRIMKQKHTHGLESHGDMTN